jgi:hypothetical protein
VGALRLVELERACHCLQDALRHTGRAAAFESGVVVDADAGEERDLFTPEPGDSTVAYQDSPACSGVILARREVRNSRISFLASTCARVTLHRAG